MVEQLKRRRQLAMGKDCDVVFPSPAGRLRDPKNTNRDLHRVYDAAG